MPRLGPGPENLVPYITQIDKAILALIKLKKKIRKNK